MDPGWDGNVELHKGGYWSVSLCAGVGGASGAAGVRGANGVVSGSGGSVGGDGGNSEGGGGVGGIWLCFLSDFWVEWWGVCGGGGVGGLWIGVVVWLEDGFVVLEWEGDFLRCFSLKSVAGNTFVGGCLFGIVICDDEFFDFFYFFDFLELLEMGMLVWCRWPELWG